MSTPERLTLAERMEQARLRAVAAREPLPGAAAAAGHGPHGSHASHASHASQAAHAAHAPRAAHALQVGKAAHGVPGAPGARAVAASHGPHGMHAAHLPYAPPGPHGEHRGGRPTQHHGPAWQVPAAAGDHLVLMPGQMHFGATAASVRTLLGSCVAVTLWHPTKRIGGMCHYLLPTRNRRTGDTSDGRYGDEALEAMVHLLRKAGTEPSDYHAHLYGGADTMPDGAGLKFNVGERNIEQGFSLVDRYGFQIQGVDVGEDVPRSVHLVLATGAVDMRRSMGKAPPPVNPTSLLHAPPAPHAATARKKHHA